MRSTGDEQPPRVDLLRRVGETAKDVGFAVGAQGVVSGLLAEGMAADLIGAAAPPVLSLTAFASVWAFRRYVRRGTKVLEVASTETDQTPDELADAIRNSEGASELFARVMEAAAATRLEEKVYALGHALAQGVSDPSHLDEAHMLVEALAVIEAPHVLLLDRIADKIEADRAMGLELGGDAVPPDISPPLMLALQVLEREFQPSAALHPVIAALTAVGLIYDPMPGEYFEVGAKFTVSPLGNQCIQLLIEAASHPRAAETL